MFKTTYKCIQKTSPHVTIDLFISNINTNIICLCSELNEMSYYRKNVK